MRPAILTVCFFLLAGCIPCSERPLSMPGRDELDGRLYGTWCHRERDESVFVHFGRDKSSGLLKVVYVESKKNGGLELIEFAGHNTNSRGFRYLNLKWVYPSSGCTGYLPVKYVLSGNTLKVCIASVSAIEEAVGKGELKGEVINSLTVLKDEPDKMLEYFQKHDRELFPDMQPFKRMELPASMGRRTASR